MSTRYLVCHSAFFFVLSAMFFAICVPISFSLEQFSLSMVSGGFSFLLASFCALEAMR